MAIPYQPSYTINPKYGFRYGGSAFAPPTSPINAPDYTMQVPEYKTPEKPIPTVSGSTVMGSDNDSDNGSAQASNQMSLNQANQNIGQQNIEEEQPENTGMFSPKPSVTDFIPFGGLFNTEPAIPKSGFGSQGSYSSNTGGQFKDGRSYDPITGVANQEYANQNSFLQGNYMTNLMDNISGEPKYDPFGDVINNDPLGAFFSDPDNAYKSSSDPSAGTGSYQQAIQNSNKEGSANFGMGTLSNQDMIMRKVGADSGIPDHSLVKTRIEKDGSKTILGTTKQGAQIKGQDLHLPKYGSIEGVEYGSDVAHGMDAKAGEAQGGVYSTTGDQDSGSTVGTTSATATVGNQGAYSSYADDAQSSGSGSGGGK